MLCLVLSSSNYKKKDGSGIGDFSSILYFDNLNGVSTSRVQTIFNTGLLSVGGFYSIEFAPHGSISSIAPLKGSEYFPLLVEEFENV